MDNSPISQPAPVVHSQFVVQKSVFFGVTKRLLTIKEDKLELNSLNFDKKHQEVFYFADIMMIQFSNSDETQFTVTMRNYSKLTLYCQVRTQCLCDIYLAWDKHTPQRVESSTTTYPSYQVSKTVIPGDNQIFMETKVVVYRTHLELIHQGLHYPESQGHFYVKVEGSDNVVESTLTIPFYLIEAIYKTHMGIVLEMRDSLARHELLFYDMEKSNDAVYKIQTNYKTCTNCYIEINNDMFDEGFATETVVPKSYDLFLFHTKAYKVLESGHLMPIKVALSDCYLVEIDIENEIVIQKYDISTVNNVVRMVSGLAGIQVIFEDFTVVTYIPPNHHKGLLASNLFTIANWKKSAQEYALQNDFIHSMIPKYNYIVYGWINDQIELGYEIELIRKFCTSTADDEFFYTVLHEFNLNARLKTYTNTDNNALKVLIHIFNKNLKIIVSKEFISYWEAFQGYVGSRCNPEFEKGPLRRQDSDSGLKNPDAKLKNLLNKFQFEIAEKFPNIRFSTKTLPLMVYRTEEILKAITILISSRSLFRELAGNKKEAALYESFLIDVAKLIDSPYPTLSHAAGCFYRAFCRFSDLTEQKTESSNKNFVLRSKVNLMQTVSEILARRVLIKKDDQKEHENMYILSILACLRIIKTFVYERKDTTNPDDLQMILGYISKPYYFAIFNFLSRYRSIACVYNTTIILNSFFKNCTNREMYRALQNRFINNSSLILLHTILVLSSLSVLQRKISVILLSHLFFDNANACSLICRILPKNLFRKVDFMSNDITKWTAQQWEQLFSLTIRDISTNTEVWTSECREELLVKLRQMDEDINSRFKYCPPNKLQKLFVSDKDEQGEFLLNIRWNHEEYEIRYDFLQHKIPVGKFYLTSLLHDSAEPKLTMQIGNAAKLWNDLSVKFIGTTKVGEMAIILKTMILLYRDYYASIKDLNTMDHWLRCIRAKEYKRVWYLILQLLYTSITVDDVSTSRYNIKKLVDSEGITALADVLSGLYFMEDHNKLTEEAMDELRDEAISKEDMDFNYTNLAVPKQAYSPSLEKSCMIYLIVNIYKGILVRYKDKKLNKQTKFVYPIPTGKFHILDKGTLLGLIYVLLLKDDDLSLEVLEFFSGSLCDKFTYQTITDKTPLYEFLLYNITPKNIHAKLRLLAEIYSRISEENDEDEVDVVKQYTTFTFKNITPEIVEGALAAFPLLRYFPKHLINKLVNYELEDFAEIFFAPSYETPQLIWNSYMKDTLVNAIDLHLQDFIYELTRFSESKKVTAREQMPQYNVGTFDVIYDNLHDEVYCGPMFLRVWTTKLFMDFKIPQEEVPIFLNKLTSLLLQSLTVPLSEASAEHFSNLLIILKAHAKAIKVYALTRYGCFGEILTILKYLPEKIAHWDPVQQSDNEPLDLSAYIQTLCKLIFRAIRLEGSDNATQFARTKGIEVVLLILNSVVHRINVGDKMQSYNYYSDIQISYEDLKMLDRISRIIVKMLQKCYNELSSLSSDDKLQLFLSLRNVSKIPLILFEYVRTYHVKSKTTVTQTIELPSNKSVDATPNANTEEIVPNRTSVEGEVVEKYDSATTSVLELILAKPDSPQSDVCIMKIFIVTKNLLDLLVECSVDVNYIPTFIQAGLGWRFLEFLTYFKDIGEVSEESTNPHYHTMLMNIEKICNIFRNIVMYSNEAYIWKVAGASTESNQVDAVVSTKAQASEVSRSLSKIDATQKNLLALFFECILNLLGKRLLQILLSGYTQPHVAPNDKDVASINKFLGYFSKELTEPTNLWNSETRQELKNKLIEQILLIIGTQGGEFINLIENFKYKLHQRNLLVGEIFVSQYNKNPQWRISDPADFMLETLNAIEVLRRSLATGESCSPYLDIEADIPCLLTNFEEALISILNVITHNDSEATLLTEPILTQLGSILNDPQINSIENAKVSSLKYRVLLILIHLSKTNAGSQKILENTTTMRNLFKILSGNTKECAMLYPKILRLIHNASSTSNGRSALLRYGYYVVLLETVVKTEIFAAKDRQKGFELLMEGVRSKECGDALKRLIVGLFPLHVQELFITTNNSVEIVQTLDNGYDTPKAMWSKMMRLEVSFILSNYSTEIQEEWNKCKKKDISLEEKRAFWDGDAPQDSPSFPEIEESVRVKDIFLKNFNRIPVLDKDTNIAVFIDELASHINDIYDGFVNKAIRCSQFGLNDEAMRKSEIQEFKKLSGHFVTLLTSLLLGIDQFIFEIKAKEERALQKELNQVAKEFNAEEEGDVQEVQEESPLIQEKEEIFLSENALSCIIKCIDLFSKPMIHPHILSTVLQLLFLIIESHRGFVVVKSNNVLDFLQGLLKKIPLEPPLFTHVEEKMILCLFVKVLLKDPTLVWEAIEECLEPIRKIAMGNKPYLTQYIEQCATILFRHPERGRQAYDNFNKERQLITVEAVHDCMPNQFIQTVWRNCTKGWNPYRSSNILNLLYQKNPENNLEYPAISDYAVLPLVHPRKENEEIEQRIGEYAESIIGQHTKSLDCEEAKEGEMNESRSK